MRKYLGQVGVDSGQLMVTDPCYLTQYQDNDFQDIRVYQHKDDPNKTLQFGVDFPHYGAMITGHNGMDMNQLLEQGIYKEAPKKVDGSYSYNGACSTTIASDGGELGNGLGVAFRSGYGDGSYEVYAEIHDGIIHKVEIILVDDE